MAQKISRRAIAAAVVTQLTSGKSSSKDIMKSLAAYLIAHKMNDQASMIMNDIASALMSRNGQLTVEISSARTLTPRAVTELTDYLKSITNASSVDMHLLHDPNLIGGIIARTPDAELDISIRSKLRQLTAIA